MGGAEWPADEYGADEGAHGIMIPQHVIPSGIALISLPPPVNNKPETDDFADFVAERAAIREYEGRLLRDEAEILAVEDVRRMLGMEVSDAQE